VVLDSPTALELDDIQRGVLHPRPSPYVGTYLLMRIDDRRVGRALLRRLMPVILAHMFWDLTALLSSWHR